MKCSANNSQVCGGSDRILVYPVSCSGAPVPRPPGRSPSPPPTASKFRYFGCNTDVSKALPYCDQSKPRQARVGSKPRWWRVALHWRVCAIFLYLTSWVQSPATSRKAWPRLKASSSHPAARVRSARRSDQSIATARAVILAWDAVDCVSSQVDDILGRLNLTEKIALGSPTHNPFCECHTTPIPSAGLPDYKWLTEVNSCVDTACAGAGRCPTTFVGPNNMAASFNRSSWWLKGDVISTDMRALNNAGSGTVGLTGYGPNINVVKDPRYGRNSELPGEDPVLTGEYAKNYVQGMQQWLPGPDGQKYLKMLASLKHYTAYSVETNRFD